MVPVLVLAAALGLAPDLAAATQPPWTTRCAAALRTVASSEGVTGTVRVAPAVPLPGALPSVRFESDPALARLDLDHPRPVLLLRVVVAAEARPEEPSSWARGWGGVHGEERVLERRFRRHRALLGWPRAPGYVDFGPRAAAWMQAIDRCLGATAD